MDCIGWLSPQGELIACKGHAHMDMARKIATDMGIDGYTSRMDDVLLNRNWIRISLITYGDCGLSFWVNTNPTEIQRSFLLNIYNERYDQISHKGMETLTRLNII